MKIKYYDDKLNETWLWSTKVQYNKVRKLKLIRQLKWSKEIE